MSIRRGMIVVAGAVAMTFAGTAVSAQGPGFARPPAFPAPPASFPHPVVPPAVIQPPGAPPFSPPGRLAGGPAFPPGLGAPPPLNPPGLPVPGAGPVSVSPGTVTSPGSLASANSIAAGGTFHSEDQHFSFRPPANWAPIAPTDIGFIRQMSGIAYVTGYRRAGQVIPYLLVQVLPVPPGDPAAGLAEFRKSIPGATYDDRRKMFQFRTTRPVPGGIPSDLHSFLFIGKQEAVAIHCYELASEHGAYEPTFQNIADSFQFDPGYDYSSRGLGDVLRSLFTHSPSAAGAPAPPGLSAGGGPAPAGAGSGGPVGGPFFGDGARDGAIAGGVAGALLTLILRMTGLGKRLRTSRRI